MAGVAARHPHLVAGAVAASLLACVVLGPWLWSVVRDQRTEGRWELRTGEQGVPAGLAIEIDGDQVTGEGPCNGFSATWSPDAGASQLLSTAMGCAPPVVRAEETFFQLLEAGTVEVEDNRLHLRSSGVDLVFDRVDER